MAFNEAVTSISKKLPRPMKPRKSGAEIAKEKCIARGGRWDGEKCIMPAPIEQPKPQEPTKLKAKRGEIVITDAEGKQRIQTPQDIASFGGIGAKEALETKQRQQQEAQLLSGQVGQYQPLGTEERFLGGVDPTESLITGLTSAIPRALTLAGGAATAGFTAGLATGGTASIPLAAAGAAVTFIGSIAASMISNAASQRRDTTTAQQRVLDEGKMTLQDWSTAAAANPAGKVRYVAEFNKQLAQIDQAHRQMITDTNADVLKFETALPNLAEFEAFYSSGGERDILIDDMFLSLSGGMPLEVVEFRMLEMANRRKE